MLGNACKRRGVGGVKRDQTLFFHVTSGCLSFSHFLLFPASNPFPSIILVLSITQNCGTIHIDRIYISLSFLSYSSELTAQHGSLRKQAEASRRKGHEKRRKRSDRLLKIYSSGIHRWWLDTHDFAQRQRIRRGSRRCSS